MSEKRDRINRRTHELLREHRRAALFGMAKDAGFSDGPGAPAATMARAVAEQEADPAEAPAPAKPKRKRKAK